MAKRVSVDRWLFTVTMLLVFVGLVMVFSASAVMARERFGTPYAFLLKQLGWAAAGLAASVGALRGDAALVFWVCIWSVAGAALFSDFSCELAARPDSGVSESICRPPKDRVPHHSVADCRGHRGHHR